MTPEQNTPFDPEKNPERPVPLKDSLKEVYAQWEGAPPQEPSSESEPQKTAAAQELEELQRRRAEGHVVNLDKLKHLSEIVDRERLQHGE